MKTLPSRILVCLLALCAASLPAASGVTASGTQHASALSGNSTPKWHITRGGLDTKPAACMWTRSGALVLSAREAGRYAGNPAQTFIDLLG